MTDEAAFEIELLNEGKIVIRPGQTVLEALLESGIPHQHACGGNAICSTCRVIVIAGRDCLSVPSEDERALAEGKNFPADVRLACQTEVMGAGVHLCRMIRDETDAELIAGEADAIEHTRGVERDLAMLFLDIRDFTPFVEAHLPYDVIHILGRFHLLIRNAIEAEGGRVVGTAGDGMFSVFGLETELPEAAAAGVRAGYRILQDVGNLNRNYLTGNFGVCLDVGIGLHTGRVICGNVFGSAQGGFTAVGLPVNAAARLEQATKELNNSFLVSQEAYVLLDDPPAAPSAEMELKGISRCFCVYKLGHPYRAEAPVRDFFRVWRNRLLEMLDRIRGARA
ncbi:MAG: adenylate/guanylate cyclase domain-containing protein [bacterium]|nr:adenylate/guanylate cyclase domain-containing protein [bacterium]